GEIVDPGRVGDEPHVYDVVGVQGQAVLEPERHDVDPKGPVRLVPEALTDAPGEVVHVEIARVDRDVGASAQVAEYLPFLGDPVEHSARTLERVGTPDRFVRSEEHTSELQSR